MSHLGSPANKRCAILKAGMFVVVTIETIFIISRFYCSFFFWFPTSFCFFLSFGFCNDTIVLLNLLEATTLVLPGTLRKTRRQRQRERHQTIGLMSKTIAVHVHYNSWYISLPSSAKTREKGQILRCLENVNHDG